MPRLMKQKMAPLDQDEDGAKEKTEFDFDAFPESYAPDQDQEVQQMPSMLSLEI